MYDERNRPGERPSSRSNDRGGGGERERRGTPLADLDPALTEVSRKLIGCAIEVHKALGPGFDKSCYVNALRNELDGAGIAYVAAHPVPVVYHAKQVGTRPADLVIDQRFIVEVMTQRTEIGGFERAALRALLRAADLELGLIINFSERRLKDGLVRVLNPDKLNAMKGSAGAAGGVGARGEHDDYDHGDAPHDTGGFDPDSAGNR